ncbi:MAG: dihydrolipoyl dehydrogenase [Chloroflexi bacterium]|nr:dihydrolipoyl dehydrogenase [Chloroflexota bacterium]
MHPKLGHYPLGGYVAAIRASQLGLKTCVVEKDEVGGICLNWGCIPSKALLRNAEIVSFLKRPEEWGIAFDGLRLDFGKAVDRSRQVVDRMVRGVHTLLRKNRVEHVKGTAIIRQAGQVEVLDTGQRLTASSIVVATGARPRALPGLEADGALVITSREALERKALPSSALIVGGGATGMEFAYLYNAYGVQVTVVELLPHLLPLEDEEISQQIERAFSRQGISFHTGSKVVGLARGQGAARATVETPSGVKELQTDLVLVSVGVQGNVDGLGLEGLGVAVEKGYIPVDDRMQTNVPGIYAIGDVTGKLLLAHVASAQGVLAAEAIAGRETRPLDYRLMPRAVYCQPQVASFGLTEREAIEKGHKVKVGRFPFLANGKAQALGEAQGLVKIVADEAYGEILGAHMVGPEVTEILAEVSMARLLEGTVTEAGWLVHSHPTLSEAVKEAALAALGEAIHI